MTPSPLERYFTPFAENVTGWQQVFESPYGEMKILYADWTASGRAYAPIEACLQNEVAPFVANTHSGGTVTGTLMSQAYAEAKAIIKEHVNACKDDVLLFCGSGMTSAVNKLQRILGMRIPERVSQYLATGQFPEISEALRPVVFVTHMEHHSNHTSWLETIATVEVIKADNSGNPDLVHLRELLDRYRHRRIKIAAVTACSNVTGIETDYHQIARIVHAYDGWCFVDFACSAPYVHIDMHPDDPQSGLDAVYFSMHKFLGGPGTPGVLLFHKKLYANKVPDQPGGGTMVYSNPWEDREYHADIEEREDGGTPPFLQAIKAAMCIKLKEQMGVENMQKREAEMLELIFTRFAKMKNVKMLASGNRKRLAIVSFIIEGAHHNLVVKLLNDRFGIQTRGGCSCAGTYGHVLLNVDKATSHKILRSIRSGNLLHKPGWIRLSVHPVMTNTEIDSIMNAIELTARHFPEWGKEYTYDSRSNEFYFNGSPKHTRNKVTGWFEVSSRK